MAGVRVSAVPKASYLLLFQVRSSSIMASNDPNLPLQYGAYDLTTGDEIPAFQYTVEATTDTQDWPLLQPVASDGSVSGMPDDHLLQGTMPAGSPCSSYLQPGQQQLQLKQYTDEEWEAMKPIITELYIKKQRPLDTVMKTMEKKHAFKARSLHPSSSVLCHTGNAYISDLNFVQ
jgi:hypothetical protein